MLKNFANKGEIEELFIVVVSLCVYLTRNTFNFLINLNFFKNPQHTCWRGAESAVKFHSINESINCWPCAATQQTSATVPTQCEIAHAAGRCTLSAIVESATSQVLLPACRHSDDAAAVCGDWAWRMRATWRTKWTTGGCCVARLHAQALAVPLLPCRVWNSRDEKPFAAYLTRTATAITLVVCVSVLLQNYDK